MATTKNGPRGHGLSLAALACLAACAPAGDPARQPPGDAGPRSEREPRGPLPPPAVVVVSASADRVASVPDVTGDGIDDVVIAAFDIDPVQSRGLLTVLAGPLTPGAQPFATFDFADSRVGGAALTALDVTGDGAADLLASDLFDGELYIVEGPLSSDPNGDGSLREAADLVITGERGGFFATAIASSASILALGTPGEPEEACITAAGAHAIALPLPSDGRVVAVDALAAAFTSGLETSTCPGAWLALDDLEDLDDDDVADLLVSTSSNGSFVFPGPLAGALTADGASLHVTHEPGLYGYGLAAPVAVLDVDGHGRRIPLFLDHEALVTADQGVRIGVGGMPLEITSGRADLDGDGADDLVTIDDEFSPTRLRVHRAAPLEAEPAYERNGAFHSASVGDATGDGRADLLILDDGGLTILSF